MLVTPSLMTCGPEDLRAHRWTTPELNQGGRSMWRRAPPQSLVAYVSCPAVGSRFDCGASTAGHRREDFLYLVKGGFAASSSLRLRSAAAPALTQPAATTTAGTRRSAVH